MRNLLFKLLSLISLLAFTANSYAFQPETEVTKGEFTMPLFDADAMLSNYYQRTSQNESLFTIQKEKEIIPHRFKDEMTYVGVPMFAAGLLLRSDRKNFRQDYNNEYGVKGRFLTNFHTEIDNYTQYVPVLLTTGLKLGGVEGRSNFSRYLGSVGLSYVVMAAAVNGIKYSVKELRPDGSTRNAFPSGHTAEAFVGATILHKEYGMTRSPWYSVAGYGIATATGVMRVLNNRHWISDVFAGAGIGILATEVGYGLADLIFKERGLLRNDRANFANMYDHPSFFGLQMGVAFGSKNLNFIDEYEDENGIQQTDYYPIKFRTATSVGAEGAWFFSKYVGVGGRLRVMTSAIDGWTDIASRTQEEVKEVIDMVHNDLDDGIFAQALRSVDCTIESDHLTEFTADAGLYFHLPLSERFALGSKLLVGRSFMQALQLNATASGRSALENADGSLEWGDEYTNTWDLITVTGNSTFKFGTGLSLTYAYKSNYAWKLFVDYDYSRKNYTMDMNSVEILRGAFPSVYEILASSPDLYRDMNTHLSMKKNNNRFVVGGSFSISF